MFPVYLETIRGAPNGRYPNTHIHPASVLNDQLEGVAQDANVEELEGDAQVATEEELEGEAQVATDDLEGEAQVAQEEDEDEARHTMRSFPRNNRRTPRDGRSPGRTRRRTSRGRRKRRRCASGPQQRAEDQRRAHPRGRKPPCRAIGVRKRNKSGQMLDPDLSQNG